MTARADTSVLLLTLLAVTTASERGWAGGGPAFWDPQTLRDTSRSFATASKEAPQKGETLDASVARGGRALETLETIADFVRGAEVPLPPSFTSGLASRTARYEQSFADAQSFVAAFGADFDEAFRSSLERALRRVKADNGYSTLEECRNASGLPMQPGFSTGKKCIGEDANAKVAAAVDGDVALSSRLQEISQRPWPVVSLGEGGVPVPIHPRSGAPLLPQSRFVRPDVLVNSYEPGRGALGKIDEAFAPAQARLEEAREQLEDDRALWQQEAPVLAAAEKESRKQALKERARALVEYRDRLDALRRDARAKVAGVILKAAAVPMEKEGSPQGFCLEPSSLGGCPGVDETANLGELLAKDRALGKKAEAAGALGKIPVLP